MNHRLHTPGLSINALFAILTCSAVVAASAESPPTDPKDPAVQKEVTMVARGTFDVKVTPQPPDDDDAGPFGRYFLDKKFHGDLEADSKGQMLAAMTAVEGSGAGVAFELVTGTLAGKMGTFVLQHRSTMQGGNYHMDVTVVPDSGTGQLVGITGAMRIIIEGKKHSYEFEYALPSK